ncbi:hypothetical protein DFJ73DRAFT_766077 [Zopfochytrium polystomum]|nr:hypothetical protein DFJ73DRAFT_766077 [Zopfochytrium polystomum]
MTHHGGYSQQQLPLPQQQQAAQTPQGAQGTPQQAQQQQAQSAAHPLSLKVMRLSRPSFVLTNPFPHEPSTHDTYAAWQRNARNSLTHLSQDLEATIPHASYEQATSATPAAAPTAAAAVVDPFDQLAEAAMSSAGSGAGGAVPQDPAAAAGNALRIDDFGLTEFLSLPASFGNIYLGETFSSYLCINNESDLSVQDAGIKAELQTASQRLTLADTVSAAASYSSSLLPTQSAEFLIHHEIKELGIHILVCSVHYSIGSERKFFRKFYKFQVLNPLAVKTKVNTLQDGRIFLEAQVQNVSGTPMFLDRLTFESSPLFNFTDLTIVPADSSTSSSSDHPANGNNRTSSLDVFAGMPSAQDPESVFGESKLLSNMDTRQYLYLLRPKTSNDPVTRTTPTLGKLDIVWRTQFGQAGRLQTSQLSRKVQQPEPFEISVVELPGEPSAGGGSLSSSTPLRMGSGIVAERPFRLRCQLRNNLPTETLRVTVSGVKNKMSSVLLWGPSEVSVGEVGPLGIKEFELEFFPLVAGLHKVTGLRLTETTSGTSRDVDVLTDVFVGVQ